MICHTNRNGTKDRSTTGSLFSENLRRREFKKQNLLKTVRLRDLLKYYLKLMSEGVDRYQCKFEIQMFRLRSSLDYDLR